MYFCVAFFMFCVIIITEIKISYCTLKIEYFRNKYEKRKTMKIATLNVGHNNYARLDDKINYRKLTKTDKENILSRAIIDTTSTIEELTLEYPKVNVFSLTEIYVAVLQNRYFISKLNNLGLTYFVPNCNHCFPNNGQESASLQLSTCIIMKKEVAKNFRTVDAKIMTNLFPVNKKGNSFNSCTARECRISSNEMEITSLYIPTGISSQKYMSIKSLEKLLSEMRYNFTNNSKRYIYLGDFNLILPNFENDKLLEAYKTKFPKPYFFFKDFLKDYDDIRKTNDTWTESDLKPTHGSEKIDYIFSSQFKAAKSSVHSINPKTFINKYQQEIQIIDHKLLLTEIEY